ncbi:hypothetical protein MBAV_004146 [Candidatus Magnetobacterium bavaricum]|uniref:Uncharacterized protein n=1 Tax=Candidatus Magnetobacterium bavaricum TaxID=29290 RepID=A0A0F3GNZ5_9BACT|nr:hypothetical protein MBAV_004146 [Candidatus Magnetobacterium bavaricum]
MASSQIRTCRSRRPAILNAPTPSIFWSCSFSVSSAYVDSSLTDLFIAPWCSWAVRASHITGLASGSTFSMVGSLISWGSCALTSDSFSRTSATARFMSLSRTNSTVVIDVDS